MELFRFLFATCALWSIAKGACPDLRLPLELPTITEVLHYPRTVRYDRFWDSVTVRSNHPISAVWGLQKENGNMLKNVVVRENDPEYVTKRYDHGDLITFVFKPRNSSHNLFVFENLWFGLKVNYYDCHVVHVDLHFSDGLGANVSQPQKLGKIYALPEPDKLALIGSSETFSIQVVRETLGLEDMKFIFESVSDDLSGSKIEYKLHSSYVELDNLTYSVAPDGERIVHADYNMDPVTSPSFGTNRFFYNVKYAAGYGSYHDAFISILFNLRDRSDSAPAVGVSQCFSPSRMTYHERMWPVVPRIRGYQSCLLVQVNGKPTPEVALALTDESGSIVERLLDGMFQTKFSSIGPYNRLKMYVLPPSSEDKWAVVAVKNVYNLLNVRVKIPAIERTEIAVAEGTVFGEHTRTIKLECQVTTANSLTSFNIYKAKEANIPPQAATARPGSVVMSKWKPLVKSGGGSNTSLTLEMTLSRDDLSRMRNAGEEVFCAAVGQYDLALQRYDVLS